jgi:hypothetical protein
MSDILQIDYGVLLEIEAPLTWRGTTFATVCGYAYSWPNRGTLLAVSFAGEQIPDPFLYAADDAMDAVISEALWREARARSDDLQNKFDEEAEPVRLQLVNG